MLTELQKRTAQAIVKVFETGAPGGDYGAIARTSGDPGGLSYGCFQATLNGGTLGLLLRAYTDTPAALLGAAMQPYAPRAEAADPTLGDDLPFRALLADAAGDPVMRETQDALFDRLYWQPACRHARRLGVTSALGVAVIHDGLIHGSFAAMRDRADNRHGFSDSIGEHRWITAYVSERRAWLAGHKIRLLRQTACRMRTFHRLIGESLWDLPLPLHIRGVRLTRENLQPQMSAAARPEMPRLLRPTRPPREPMQGEDVRQLSDSLIAAGIAAPRSRIYSDGLAEAVRRFQRREGLICDGLAGPATRSALESLAMAKTAH